MSRAGEITYFQSPRALAPYAVKLTAQLEHWAVESPDRTFLAQRDEAQEWRRLSYREALRSVRAIAQGLIDRSLNSQRPVLIVSGNSIEHALLALGCLYAGVPYAPVSPSYLRALPDLTALRQVWKQIEPALVFVQNGETVDAALHSLLDANTELVSVNPPGSLRATPFEELTTALSPSCIDEAHARVTGDTVAKIMFTSGSTGAPKGVITTQRMLCSNQQMIRSLIGSLSEEPPVLCDWLPWNHVFGGSHNFGIALYNGGTLYIDEGRPTPSGFETTLANLRSVQTTAYFNVPKGFQLLLPALRTDQAFNRRFFRHMRAVLSAGATLSPPVWKALQQLSREACGQDIQLVNAFGSTESAPMAFATSGSAAAIAGQVGLPVPGVELKLVPVNGRQEARLRGPNITPGYLLDPERTAAAFDEEGFYKTGDALRFVNAVQPDDGLCFDGRLDGNFKLSTGTWVNVDQLRAELMSHLAGLANDVVLAAPDRDYATALLFLLPGVAQQDVARALHCFAGSYSGSTKPVRRFLLLNEQPSFAAGEITAKGSVNQQAVLRNRAALIEELYAGSSRVMDL